MSPHDDARRRQNGAAAPTHTPKPTHALSPTPAHTPSPDGMPRITVITPHYPASRYPERGAFVERLVRQWRESGVPVGVIAPDALPLVVRSIRKPLHDVDPAGAPITRPVFMSYGNKKGGMISRYALTRSAFVRAVLRGGGAQRRDGVGGAAAEIYYGKFLFRGGEGALALSRRFGVPAVADMGESWSFRDLDARTRRDAERVATSLAGIVCVSPRLRDEAIDLGADPARVIVAPNDVDLERFRPIDRREARDQLGLPQDRFLVAFTGHFVERKGPLRVAAAIERVNDGAGAGHSKRAGDAGHTGTAGAVATSGRGPGAAPSGSPLRVAGVFLGRGSQVPAGRDVLHAGSVPNEELPLWLCAADLFVLPTLAEGHCNAINEAVACGLPVVSSEIADVRGQVEEAYAELVDPADVAAIAEAIRALRDDPHRREQMSAAAVDATHGAGRVRRADTILRFLTHTMKEWNDA